MLSSGEVSCMLACASHTYVWVFLYIYTVTTSSLACLQSVQITDLTIVRTYLLSFTLTDASNDSYPSSSTVAPKKSSQPSKLVDLGAASSFASQQRQQQQQQQQQQEQLVTSAPVAQSSDGKGTQGDLMNIFGAFSSAPTATQPVQQAQNKGDLFDADFADFQGAFSSQQAPQTSQPTHSTGTYWRHRQHDCVFVHACTYVLIHLHHVRIDVYWICKRTCIHWCEQVPCTP